MLKTYIKTAFRSQVRKITYSIVNILGLSVEIAAVILIFMIVQFELSFDNFYKNKDRIYRLVSVPYKQGAGFNATAAVPLPVTEGLRVDYPQLEKVATIFGRDAQITVDGEKQLAEKKFNKTGSLYFA